jgi:hypothetical protein
MRGTMVKLAGSSTTPIDTKRAENIESHADDGNEIAGIKITIPPQLEEPPGTVNTASPYGWRTRVSVNRLLLRE